MNSATDVWKKTLSMLRNDLTEVAITTWFGDDEDSEEKCTAVKLSDSCLFLHTSSKFKKEQIELRYIGLIKNALSQIFSGDFDAVILDDDGLKALEKSLSTPDYLSIDEYTFEHFVVGDSNRFAYSGALAVSEGYKPNYNPLFIYGESGLGKTHLLNAIRNAVEKNFPLFNIVYASGEAFTNELVAALQHGYYGKLIEFREKYRSADILLMDDFHFIAGKEQTQEEFFNTFNTLYEHGKQIVFTSDRPPNEMTKLTDRLVTRLHASLKFEILPPDDVLRIAIIKNKAKQLGVILPDEVTNYIAENVAASVRHLEGAVKMIIAFRDIMGEDITVDKVKEHFEKMFIGTKDNFPTIDTIIDETARFYNLTADDLKGRSQSQNIVLPRQVAMYLIRKLTNTSLVNTGKAFGRDHSTVKSSLTKVESNIKESVDFSIIIKDITLNIQAKTNKYSESSTH